jgi:hypothetical protein
MAKVAPFPKPQPSPSVPPPEPGVFYTDSALIALLAAHERALRASMLAYYEPDLPAPPLPGSRHLSVVR